MTKVLVSATNKGGEGKTTTSINLAEYASIIMGKKVLAIDMDPQANFSSRYILMEHDPAYQQGKIPPEHPDYDPETDTEWDGRSSIAGIFHGEEVLPYPTDIKNLEILPAHSNRLQEAETVSKKEVLEKVYKRLKEFIDLREVQEEYDLIVIDTPPSKGPLTIASIRAATHIIMPSQMERFSMDGIYGMLQIWKQETYERPAENPIELVGIFPNKIRRINLHTGFLESLIKTEGLGEHVIPHSLSARTIYSEMLVEDANPKSIFVLPKKHVARVELEKACEYIMAKVFKEESK